jgi:hypothetical protein
VTSPYRSEIDALRERKASLEQEAARLREQTTQLDALRAREAQIAAEIAAVEAKMRAGDKRALPMLDQVRVASPCNESWGEMVGDERVRFCLKCEKNVYNLSAMKRDEAEALLQERLQGELCVRFYQRADGTILTEDCPVGVTKKRRKKAALAIAGAGAMAFAAVSALAKPRCGMQMQGAVAIDPGYVMGEKEPAPTVMGTATAIPEPAPPTTGVQPPTKVQGVVVPRMGKPSIR